MKRLLFAVIALAVVTIGIACLPSDGQITYPPVSLSAANTWTALQAFTDGTQGLYVGAYTGGGGFGAIYAYGTTPGSNNYVFAANPSTATIVNNPVASNIDVGGNTICSATASGLACAASKSLAPGTSTVASLPAASSSAGQMFVVTDSTAVSAEGQTCVGSSTNKALAFSNGTAWKCF